MKASSVLLLTDRIYSKVSSSHFCKEFIFIINDYLKLSYQAAHLLGENPKLIPGSIGNLNIQISSSHFCGSIFNLRDWKLNKPYNNE